MRKIVCLSVLCICSLLTKAQTEEKISDINHYAGLDIGYSSYPRFVNNNLEYNLNYLFNPHYFCMKSQFGISAGSNMGLIYKVFLTMGFSTKTTKIISWHLLTGVGTVFPEKTYNNSNFQSLGPIIESGFYLNFFKSKNKLIGINTVVFTEDYRNEGYPGNAISANVNISFNLKLNK